MHMQTAKCPFVRRCAKGGLHQTPPHRSLLPRYLDSSALAFSPSPLHISGGTFALISLNLLME